MSVNDSTAYQEPELSREERVLFTHLQRLAAPIVQLRHDATKELGLVDDVEGLYAEMRRKQPEGPEQASVAEWNGLVDRWAELMRRLDAWILDECRGARLLAYGLHLPLTHSSVAMPIPTGLFHTHELDVEKGTLLGGHWSFSDLRVCLVTKLKARERELVENGLWVFGVWLAEETMQIQHGGAEPPRTLTNGSEVARPGSSANYPLYVSLAGASEHLVLKTETLRQNTRYGKKMQPKAEPADPVRPAASAPEPTPDPIDHAPPRKDSGPRTLNPEIEAYLKERSQAKLCKPTWAEECLHLHGWAKSKFAKEIRSRSRVLAKLKWLREVHAAVYYQLNPEFDRLGRFRQESD